jgi:hypothetical protein
MALMGQRSVLVADTTISFFRLAAVQRTKRKLDLACLPPKRGFIAAEAIECEIG